MAVIQDVRWQPPFESSPTSLQKLGFNISTIGGRLDMSGRRGRNVNVQYRDGTLWTPKDYEEKELELAMWVVGADETTGIPAADPQSEMWTNLEKLRRLFVTDSELGFLTYKHPVQNKDIVAECEVRSQIDFDTMAGATRAAFIVSMHTPGVWFRDPAFVGETVFTSRADAEQWSVTIDSDVLIKDSHVFLKAVSGTPANVRIFNESLSAADHWVQYLDVFVTGEEVEIDVGNWRATLDGTTRVTGNVRWSGNPQFFWLKPGQNDLKLEVTGGPIDVKVAAKGAYW